MAAATSLPLEELRQRGQGLHRGGVRALAQPVHVAGCTFPASFPERYTVRLHFAEPDSVQAGERVFDVLKELIGDRDVAELDRGHLSLWRGDYRGFLRLRDQQLAAEALVQREAVDPGGCEDDVGHALRSGIDALPRAA